MEIKEKVIVKQITKEIKITYVEYTPKELESLIKEDLKAKGYESIKEIIYVQDWPKVSFGGAQAIIKEEE